MPDGHGFSSAFGGLANCSLVCSKNRKYKKMLPSIMAAQEERDCNLGLKGQTPVNAAAPDDTPPASHLVYSKCAPSFGGTERVSQGTLLSGQRRDAQTSPVSATPSACSASRLSQTRENFKHSIADVAHQSVERWRLALAKNLDSFAKTLCAPAGSSAYGARLAFGQRRPLYFPDRHEEDCPRYAGL